METIEFEFKALPWNIVFGRNALRRLPQALSQFGFRKALVLSTPGQREQAQQVAVLIGDHCAGIFSEAKMHVPVATYQQALAEVQRSGADCSVTVGGGSTTGLGKILALKAKLPFIAVPTTYAGSEMTNIWGLTDRGTKRTGRDIKVVPLLTLYDPELTLALPAGITGSSGMNAMAHAVVTVMAEKRNPVISALAEQAIRALASSLPVLVKAGNNLEARTQALYGACLAGAALGAGTTGIHHRLCHILGGTYHTPHADTHAILLPHTIAYNSRAVPEGAGRVAAAMNCESAAQGMYELLMGICSRTSLSDIGITENDINDIAGLATQTPCQNPEPVTTERINVLLKNACHGIRPQ